MTTLRPKTRDLIDLWVYAQGESEVPRPWLYWGFMSALAATIADRISVCEDAGLPPTTPHLYVFMLGHSGRGKSVVCRRARDIVTGVIPEWLVYDGKMTGAMLLNRIGTPAPEAKSKRKKKRAPVARSDPKRSKVFLLTDELAAAIGSGDNASIFIKLMTQLFTAGPGIKKEGTITRGERWIDSPCINWLAGTTFEWLRECITTEAVHGGFFARIIPVLDPNDETRYARPVYPPDRDATLAYIHRALVNLAKRNCILRLTKEAASALDGWHMTRPKPDEVLRPWWNRQREFVLKIAILLTVAANPRALTISRRQIGRAILRTNKILGDLPEVMRAATSGVEGRLIQSVYEHIRTKEPVKHFALAERMAMRGVGREKLQVVLETLVEARLVIVEHSERGSRVYRLRRR